MFGIYLFLVNIKMLNILRNNMKLEKILNKRKMATVGGQGCTGP